jgi:hypothetical protein
LTQPTTPAQQLQTVLAMDFRAADLGDTDAQFTARLTYVVTQALARALPVTAAQQEAGARYVLLGAQIRQLGRQLEEFTAVGEVTLKQGLATRMGQLRYDQQVQLRLSALPNPSSVTRPASVLVSVVPGF